LKTPDQVHLELAAAVRAALPYEFNEKVTITVTKSSGETNWIAGVGNLPAGGKAQYEAKLVALRKSDPIIDWQDG
jgi:hypothetical protein